MSRVKEDVFTEFSAVTGDLLGNSYVRSMSGYNHHGKISTHYHSVYVALTVTKICRVLNIDKDKRAEIIRAALLHDLYLYDWHTEKHAENHIYYHPKEAVRNIDRLGVMKLTDMQRHMIIRHMFPLAPLPDSLGGWLLTAADKYCATMELAGLSKGFAAYYRRLTEKNGHDV